MTTAFESAVAVGRSLGLRVDEAVVIRESLNLVVHLAPAPIVARVALLTATVRDVESLRDSLALARHLHALGLPVGPPTEAVDPGPHVGPGGWWVTLWRHLATIDRRPDPAFVGQSLRAMHEAAAGYDGPLRHVGPIREVHRLVDAIEPRAPDHAARLRRYAEALDLPDLPVQAVHGDAHFNNVLVTAGGPLWIDWEESWHGPTAWDLASLGHRRIFGDLIPEIDTALRAYGDHDKEAVDAYGIAFGLWAAAWGVRASIDDGVLGDGARRRLEWLGERLG